MKRDIIRKVMIRGIPVFILALGFISLVFGTLFLIGSEQMKSQVIEGFGRSEGVNSAADIEAMSDLYTAQVQTMEDAAAAQMGYTGPFNSENKLPDEVKQELYTNNPGYPPTIDAQLAYGLGTMLLGTAQLTMYSGIAMLTIGISLILTSVVIIKATGGMAQLGAGLLSMKVKLAQSIAAEIPSDMSEMPERA